MTLLQKTLLVVSAAFVGLIVILYIVSRAILSNSFASLEEQQTRENVGRVMNALDNNFDALARIAGDWATWDDSYTFVQDENDEFVEINISDQTLTNLGLNWMLFFDASGELVYGYAVDLNQGVGVPLPDDLEASFPPDSPFLHDETGGEVIRGVLTLPEGPMLVVSAPILPSSGEGPAAGSLVEGRYLDWAEVRRLGEATGLSLIAHGFDEVSLPADFRRAREALSPESPVFIRPLGETIMAGYALITDIGDSPALILRTDIHRDVYAQGKEALSFLLLALLAVGLVFGAVVLWLLTQMILLRVRRLAADVDGVRGRLSARLPVYGGDELGSLAGHINEMLASLEQAQAAMLESQSRLLTVVVGAPLALWTVDCNGTFTLLEGQRAESLGLNVDEVLGKTAAEVYADRPQVAEAIHRALKGESVNLLIEAGQATFDAQCSPLYGSSGSIIGAIGIATDISERAAAEKALKDALTDLEQKNRQLERVHVFFESTLEQMDDTLQHSSTRDELLGYLKEIQENFNRLNRQTPIADTTAESV